MSSDSDGSGSVDIPIDPVLLAAIDRGGASDDEGDQGQSSGLEDDDEDAYVDEDEEPLRDIGEVEAEEEAGFSRTDDDDAVFNRLAGYVSKAAPGQGGDLDTGTYMQEEMDLLEREELPQISRRLSRRLRRTARKPTHEVQRLLGQANMSYIQGSHQEAITTLLEVIRLDPYVYSAWTTLASCYEETGNREAARQMRFFAAHVDNDGETWKELAAEFRGNEQVPQCLYCLRKALKVDATDVDTLYELATIYRVQKQTNKAVDAFKKILRSHAPSSHDFDLLMEFHPLFLANSQQSFANTILREAFDYHIERFKGPLDHPQNENNTLQLEHVVSLTDLLLQLDKLEEALVVVKRGQRWLQGRIEEKSWDSMDDDREFDPPGMSREAEGAGMEGFEGYPLDTNLRHRLALIRLRLGDDDEAFIHIEEILGLDVIQYQSFFLEIGNALLKREMWEKALDCFAAIQECERIPDDPSHIYAIGICHQQMKDYSQALEALRWVVSVDEENLEARLRLANILEETGQKGEALEIVTQVLRARAQRDKDKPDPPVENPRLSRSEKNATQKLSKRVLEDQMRSRMQILWSEVQAAEEGIEEGDLGALDRFIYAAGTMIENFRLAKSNFNKNRGVQRILKTRKYGAKGDLTSQAQVMQDRLERVMGFEDDTPMDQSTGSNYMTIRTREFYGLGCDEWLTLVIKYCCVLMVKSEEDVAMDILEHVIWSGLFNNRRSEVALRMTINACAMRTRSYEKITENSRRLAQMHQFRPEPFLIMLASLGSGGIKANNAWMSLQLQKFIHRELRISDDAVKGSNLHYNPPMQRWAPVVRTGLSRRLGDQVGEGEDPDNEDEGEDGSVRDSMGGETSLETPLPKMASPSLNAIYGQHMLSAKAYQSALFYLFRAYQITQHDPLLCSLIAQAFFGRSMNRQSDNRNYQIAQGLSFLTRYRKLSAKDAVTQEEVEYNYGRSFQGLGVAHLAVVHFERVLKSVKARMNASGDPEEVRQSSLAYQAAHNLMLLYASSGNGELVQARSMWLAI